jgi:hypothetical protein
MSRSYTPLPSSAFVARSGAVDYLFVPLIENSWMWLASRPVCGTTDLRQLTIHRNGLCLRKNKPVTNIYHSHLENDTLKPIV